MGLDWTKVLIEVLKVAIYTTAGIVKDLLLRRAERREKMTKAPHQAPRHRSKVHNIRQG